MADDFDIEAYLEAQVDNGAAKNESVAEFNGTRTEKEIVLPDDKKSEKPKSRSKDRKTRSSSRDRDKDRRKRRSRSRSRSRDRDRDRDGRSSRRRDKDEKDKERDRSKDRTSRKEKDEERSKRDKIKDLEREQEREKERALQREKKAESELEAQVRREAERKKKEIDDLTKDQRTVFVSQLTMKVNEKHIRDFFGQIGKINDIIMIRDKYTGRHKGFAYVEMAELEKIPTCLMINGVVPDFQKFPILVKASEAEKNFLAKKDTITSSTSSGGDGSSSQAADSRLYVGNLHVNITEDDLKIVLSQFGTVESIHLQRDEVGTSRGYAFVKFSRAEEAQGAFSKLGGLELAGKSIKVGFVNDSSSGASSSQHASGNWKLDDDEGTGMQMNAQSRVMLMAKLGQAAGIQIPTIPSMTLPGTFPTQPVTSIYEPPKAPPVGGLPSTCFIIKNMFVLAEETGDSWDLDIKEDVTEECQKFGKVEYCHVEANKPGGFVYLRFSAMDAAVKAANSLNGRWFAGRMITVSFIDPSQFSSLF